MIPRPVIAAALLTALLASTAAAADLEVTGRVVETDGRPAAGVEVTLLPFSSAFEAGRRQLAGELLPPPLDTAITGDDGHFRLGVPEAGLYRLRVADDDHRPMEFGLLPLLEDTTVPTLELEPEARVTVRITDLEGKPLAGALVSARRPEMPRNRQRRRDATWVPARRSAIADEKGTARLGRGDSETLTVRAFAAGHLEAETETREASVQFRLAPAVPHRLEVLDERGNPAPGALARLWETGWPVGVTDTAGLIALPLPAAGKVLLEVLTEDARSVERWLEPESWPDDESRPVTLSNARRLTGRVVDLESREALAAAFAWPAGSPSTVARTNRAGGYTLSVPGEGRLWIWAATAGYLKGISPVAEESASGPTLALQRSIAVSGEVVNEEDQPLAGVDVTATLEIAPAQRMSFQLAGEARQAVTDKAGRFRIAGLHPDAAYTVRAAKAGFAPAVAEVHRASSSAPAKLRLVLGQGRTLSGLVVEGGGGGVAGARIELFPQIRESSARLAYMARTRETGSGIEAFADESGAFTIRNLAAGHYDLEASAASFALTRLPGVEVPEGSGPIDIGTVRLAPGVTIEGRVSAARGGPLAGAEVHVVEGERGRASGMRLRSAEGPPAAVTGADGWFSIEDRRNGERVDLIVKRSGYTAAGLPGVEAPTLTPLEVELTRTSTLSGRVIDAAGVPVTEARVVVALEEPLAAAAGVMEVRGAGGSGVTDDEGRFVVEEIAPGEIGVEARASGYQTTRHSGLTIEPGQNLEGLELVLQKGASVLGRVTGPGGSPLAGVSIFEQGSQRGSFSRPGAYGVTDGDGRFRLDGVELGRRTFNVHHAQQGRRSKEIEVEPGENTLDISFEGGSRVSGRVLSEVGEPLPGASVALIASRRSWGGQTSVTDASGDFAIEAVEEGTYNLRAEKRGFATAVREGVEVRAGEVSGLEIRLDSGGTIVGRLLGLEEAEFSQVEIMAMRSPEGPAAGHAGSDGTYEITDLSPGEWQVWATLQGTGGRAEGVATVPAGGGETVLDLEFAAGLELTGQVLSAARPLPGASIMVSGLDVSSHAQGSTDTGGRFRLAGLEPGRYRLQVMNFERGLRHEEEIELDFDRDIVVEIETARISGLVVDAIDSSPIFGAELRLESLQAIERAGGVGWEPTTATDSTGYFNYTQATTGSYRLVAQKDGYAPGEQAVTVEGAVDVDGIEIRLTPTDGVTIRVLLPTGRPPRQIVVAALDATGRDVTSGIYQPDDQGLARLSTVPPGRWELLVRAEGYAVASVQVEAPGETPTIQLAVGSVLEIQVPELDEDPTIARVEILRPDGRPFRGLRWIWPTSDWQLTRGKAMIEDLPPGSWTVTVESPDGRVWRGAATVSPGANPPLVLR